MSLSVLWSAGEVSGDLHAAAVARALRARRPDLSFWGIGGDALRAEGTDLVRHARDMEAVGFAEVIRRYPFFRRAFYDVLRRARAAPPTVAVLVDYPGFNLRLARALHAMGVPVVYYICPQVWAWRRARARILAECARRLLVIFPFETDFFRGYPRLRVEFVGHPLVDALTADAAAPPGAPLPWGGAPRVALLPGSRRSEIGHNLPVLLAAAARIERERPEASFLIAAADERAVAWIRAVESAAAERPARCATVVGQARRVLREARAAWVASGTATLEAAMLGCPTVILYRTARLNYEIGRRVIRVPFLGIVNLVAGRAVCPELIQKAASPEALARALTPLLDDTPERDAMVRGMAEVGAALGMGGAAERAADAIAAEIAAALQSGGSAG